MCLRPMCRDRSRMAEIGRSAELLCGEDEGSKPGQARLRCRWEVALQLTAEGFVRLDGGA